MMHTTPPVRGNCSPPHPSGAQCVPPQPKRPAGTSALCHLSSVICHRERSEPPPATPMAAPFPPAPPRPSRTRPRSPSHPPQVRPRPGAGSFLARPGFASHPPRVCLASAPGLPRIRPGFASHPPRVCLEVGPGLRSTRPECVLGLGRVAWRSRPVHNAYRLG